MRAAATKIPHLLYEKDLLKNTEWNLWFYLQLMIYLQWILYDGNGRNPPKYTKNEYDKQRKKFPVWLPSHPPDYEMEADCFPVSENTKNKPVLPFMG